METGGPRPKCRGGPLAAPPEARNAQTPGWEAWAPLGPTLLRTPFLPASSAGGAFRQKDGKNEGLSDCILLFML